MADSIRQTRLAAVGTALTAMSGATAVIYGYPKALAPAAAKPAGTVWFWDVDQDYRTDEYKASNSMLAELHVGIMQTFSYTEDAPNAQGNKVLPVIWQTMMADPTWGGTVNDTRPFTDEITDLATEASRKLGAVWMGWALSYFVNRSNPYAQ